MKSSRRPSRSALQACRRPGPVPRQSAASGHMLGSRIRGTHRRRTSPRPQRRLSRVRRTGDSGQDRARTAGCLCWPMELADTRRAKSRRKRQSKAWSPVSQGQGRGIPLRRCCRDWCSKPTPQCSKRRWPAGRTAAGMATTVVACALRYDRAERSRMWAIRAAI